MKDVPAPVEVVWRQIADIRGYPTKMPRMSTDVYYERAWDDGTLRTKARYVMNAVPGYRFEFFVDHLAMEAQRSVVWSLDYDRRSDLDDLQGKWYIEPHRTRLGGRDSTTRRTLPGAGHSLGR